MITAVNVTLYVVICYKMLYTKNNIITFTLPYYIYITCSITRMAQGERMGEGQAHDEHAYDAAGNMDNM